MEWFSINIISFQLMSDIARGRGAIAAASDSDSNGKGRSHGLT